MAQPEVVATGTFDVTLVGAEASDPAIARRTLAKTFHGDLDATSRGEMLSVGNPVVGAAGYVALEQVTGTLTGRPGTFALQHNGTIDRAGATLSITVVPGSGTGALAGLAGTMAIDASGGRHRYTFRYTLP